MWSLAVDTVDCTSSSCTLRVSGSLRAMTWSMRGKLAGSSVHTAFDTMLRYCGMPVTANRRCIASTQLMVCSTAVASEPSVDWVMRRAASADVSALGDSFSNVALNSGLEGCSFSKPFSNSSL